YDIPDSVVGFMAGELGELPGGWPEPFRTKVLAGRSVKVGITELTADESAALDADSKTRRHMLNQLLFPAPTRQFEQFRELFGDLSPLDTIDFLYGLRPGSEHVVEIAKGVRLHAGIEAIGDVDDKGMRTVMTVLNGQLRPLAVRDRSVEVTSRQAEKANAADPGHVPAPFSGVVTLKVAEGDRVEAGTPVASIEAMKMEAAITSNVAGIVQRLAIPRTQQVDAGDLLLVIVAE
ncbi:MAG: biotin/lipoyl-containing protein, partial [Agromyces sp.]